MADSTSVYLCIPLYVKVVKLNETQAPGDIEIYIDPANPVVSPFEIDSITAIQLDKLYEFDVTGESFNKTKNDTNITNIQAYIKKFLETPTLKLPKFEVGNTYKVNVYFEATDENATVLAVGIVDPGSVNIDANTFIKIIPSNDENLAEPDNVSADESKYNTAKLNFETEIKKILAQMARTADKLASDAIEGSFTSTPLDKLAQDKLVMINNGTKYGFLKNNPVYKIIDIVNKTATEPATTINTDNYFKIQLLGAGTDIHTRWIDGASLAVANLDDVKDYIIDISSISGDVLSDEKAMEGTGFLTKAPGGMGGGSRTPKNISFSKYPHNKSKKNASNNSKKKR